MMKTQYFDLDDALTEAVVSPSMQDRAIALIQQCDAIVLEPYRENLERGRKVLRIVEPPGRRPGRRLAGRDDIITAMRVLHRRGIPGSSIERVLHINRRTLYEYLPREADGAIECARRKCTPARDPAGELRGQVIEAAARGESWVQITKRLNIPAKSWEQMFGAFQHAVKRRVAK